MKSKKPPKQAHTQLQDLPFDQYSRQFIVARLIDKCFRATSASRLKIIDLGGHKGKTTEFLSQDKVTILDIYDEEYPNYTKGDATALEYPDHAFDVACSFDVFEHIPREQRKAFLGEALRVSKLGAFIAMPVDSANNEVSDAENLLNDFFNRLYDKDHPWLREHIDYKIPTTSEIESLLDELQASYFSIVSNEIADWSLLQALIFIAAKNPEMTDLATQLNHWYNANIASVEAGVTVGYRRIYFITFDQSMQAKVRAASELLDKQNSKSEPTLQIHKHILESGIASLAAFIKRKEESHATEMAYMREQNEQLRAMKDQFEERLHVTQEAFDNLEQQVEAVYKSISWRITKPIRIVNYIRRRMR